MAIRANRVIEHAPPEVERAGPVRPDRPDDPPVAVRKVVLPRAHRFDHAKPGAASDVRELQAAIERAFVLLDEVAERDDDPDAAVLPFKERRQSQAIIGAAAGSELRHRRSFSSLLLKTVAGLAIIFLVGLVPLQKALTPASSEAFVNAPLYLVYAPATGMVRSVDRDVGSLIATGQPLATIRANGADVPVVSAGGGKVWEVLVQPGQQVKAGDLMARVAGCSASSVSASVSEGVYDKLSPGMPARFNFFGSSRFYYGTVANLLGHSDGGGNFAISPASVTRGAYRVIVALPGLQTIDNCAVGRRGAVLFNPPTR